MHETAAFPRQDAIRRVTVYFCTSIHIPVEKRVSPKSPKSESFFHLHLISDATGETLLAVGRAAAAQYATVSAIEHVFPLIRNQKQLNHALSEVEANPGIVLYTLVDKDLAAHVETRCRELGMPCLSILGPVLGLFQNYLGTETTPRIGGQHTLNADYFRRIDALNFTMLHDDGQHSEDLEQADVILVGVSRTSKTPTSIYLANRGIKTANIPLVPGIDPPPQLEKIENSIISIEARPSSPGEPFRALPRMTSIKLSAGAPLG